MWYEVEAERNGKVGMGGEERGRLGEKRRGEASREEERKGEEEMRGEDMRREDNRRGEERKRGRVGGVHYRYYVMILKKGFIIRL